MMGHRFRTESLANDFGSEVTDWAGRGLVAMDRTAFGPGSGSNTDGSWYRTP